MIADHGKRKQFHSLTLWVFPGTKIPNRRSRRIICVTVELITVNNCWNHNDFSNSEMSDFFVGQGRTRDFAEAYSRYAAGANPAENAARRKKGHFGMEKKTRG